MFGHQLYPTTPDLGRRMLSKVKKRPENILEPSAGRGDLCEYAKRRWRHAKISCCEIDRDLRAVLRNRKFIAPSSCGRQGETQSVAMDLAVVDSDFLEYPGYEHFDLILANPPFDTGDRHLLKMIDIMYQGEIVCLLNAETIRNPFSNVRKELERKLKEHNAEIEYVSGAFKGADRPTGVEVALVSIKIDKSTGTDIFDGLDEDKSGQKVKFERHHDISTKATITELVAEYNQTIGDGQRVIQEYIKNYHRLNPYLRLTDRYSEKRYSCEASAIKAMTELMNNLVSDVRKAFWRRTLDIPDIRERMTTKLYKEFEKKLVSRSVMEFSERNIRSFVLNLIESHGQSITDTVIEIFDKLTRRHCYHGGPNERNVHYFTGWKTNDAFKIAPRVVVPLGSGRSDSSAFRSCNHWSLDFRVAQELDDIDKTLSYYSAIRNYTRISDALKEAFARDENTAESSFMKVKAHKKGTIHITFTDLDALRRLNVEACRGKGWLPGDFGAKPYDKLTMEERRVADDFEGRKEYERHAGKPLLQGGNLLQICG